MEMDAHTEGNDPASAAAEVQTAAQEQTADSEAPAAADVHAAGIDLAPAAAAAQASAAVQAQEKCPCCAGRTRKRSPEEYRALMNRLSRIEGQVRGIRRMLEEDAYCPDILTQASAVNAALNAFSRELLSQHIRTCVKDDILEGREDTLDELMDTLRKLMK